MPNCVQCGIQVPEGQRICSMCVGDPDYGQDGYYREWLEDQEAWKEHERQSEPTPDGEEESSSNG